MNDRRLDHRLLCADMVEVEWTHSSGTLRIATALLEDISPVGFCLQLETGISVGSAVLVNFNGVQTQAIVRYCSWREIGYFAGLTFTPGSRWSPERFTPKHLTNLLDLSLSDREGIV